jgi:hypothetical protein
MADDDARDERLAAWLEPEPLDDVTRRRLVSTAMRESEAAESAPRRSSRAMRWMAAAAAIVVVLVGALALVTAQGGNDEHKAATPARTPASESRTAGGAGALADSAAPKAQASGGAAPTEVGDFGDLDRAANLARLRRALEAAGTGTGSSFATGSTQSEAAATALSALPCRGSLPAGTTLAVGTGTLDGRAAVVVLTDLGDGTRSIDAVLVGPCEVRPLS